MDEAMSENVVASPKGLGSPFSVLRRSANIPWPIVAQQVSVHRDFVLLTLHRLAFDVEVDENWYVARYPDVKQGIEAGNFHSAKHHYVVFGFYEDRLPRMIPVDADFYLKKYEDVSPNIRKSPADSARWHFEAYGYAEGRLPYSGWTLSGE